MANPLVTINPGDMEQINDGYLLGTLFINGEMYRMEGCRVEVKQNPDKSEYLASWTDATTDNEILFDKLYTDRGPYDEITDLAQIEGKEDQYIFSITPDS